MDDAPKQSVHLLNETETCSDYECRNKQQRDKIPEKTILDEVYLQKTLYCSGTQQNLQVHPEQRNVGIQQIFRNEPKYIELNNNNNKSNSLETEQNVVYRPCPHIKKRNKNVHKPEMYDDINEASLRRFYLPKHDQYEKPPVEEHKITMNNYSRADSSGEKFKTICICIPVEQTDSNGEMIIQEHGNKTVYCTRDSNDYVPKGRTNTEYESKKKICSDRGGAEQCPSTFGNQKGRTNTEYESKKKNCSDLGGAEQCPFGIRNRDYEQEPSGSIKKKSVYMRSVPAIEENNIEIKIRPSSQGSKTYVRPQTSPKTQQINKKTNNKSIKSKNVGVGSVRNSTFWKNAEQSETSVRPQTSPRLQQTSGNKNKNNKSKNETIVRLVQNSFSKGSEKVPHSMPTIPKKLKAANFRNYQSEVLDSSTNNALNHELFHSTVPPKVIEPAKERVLSEEQEKSLLKTLRHTQELTLQKSSVLKRSLNLDDSRTHLVYSTQISNSSPLRSKSREYKNSNNSILVIPETCRRHMIDSLSPRSVTFSCDSRYSNVEDINEKCRRLLKLNLNNSNEDFRND